MISMFISVVVGAGIWAALLIALHHWLMWAPLRRQRSRRAQTAKIVRRATRS